MVCLCGGFCRCGCDIYNIIKDKLLSASAIVAWDSYHDVFLPAILRVIKDRHWGIFKAFLLPLEK